MEQSDKSRQIENETSSSMILRAVGIIKNDVKKPSLVAGDNGIEIAEQVTTAVTDYYETLRAVSEIVIYDKWIDLIFGIEKYSHLVVLYWAHQVPEESRSLTRVHPMGRKDFPLVGIFSTCSPARPNPVLIKVVKLCGRKGNSLYVTGLDALNESPVLDIKPYVKEFYPHQDVLVPEWMQRIIREFGEGNGI